MMALIKYSKYILCTFLQLLQGILSFLFQFFYIHTYSSDAPAGFYKTTFVLYFVVSFVCLVGEFLLCNRWKSSCATLFYGTALFACCFLGLIGHVVYNIWAGSHILFWAKSILLFLAACPLACIYILVKDIAVASLLSLLLYALQMLCMVHGSMHHKK